MAERRTRRVLVVDDDRAIRDVLRLLLDSEGYESQVIASGRELAAALVNRPDVIILDVLLSGEDGRDLARRLKADAATRDIPIVLMSAHVDARQGAAEAADAFLAKPFEIDDLLALLARFAG